MLKENCEITVLNLIEPNQAPYFYFINFPKNDEGSFNWKPENSGPRDISNLSTSTNRHWPKAIGSYVHDICK